MSREFVDEIVGGDGQRWVSVLDKNGAILYPKARLVRLDTPKQAGSIFSGNDMTALYAQLDEKITRRQAQEALAGKAEQSELEQLEQAPLSGDLRWDGPHDHMDGFSNNLGSDSPVWNKWSVISDPNGVPNAPLGGTVVWYEVFTGGPTTGNRAFQIAIGCFDHQRSVHIRFKHDSSWSGWTRILG